MVIIQINKFENGRKGKAFSENFADVLDNKFCHKHKHNNGKRKEKRSDMFFYDVSG